MQSLNFTYVSILSIGRDPSLMAIRTMLLRQAGYAVIEANSSEDANHISAAWKFDVVLICHTVPEPEQRDLIASLHRHRPDLPVLCISLNKDYSGQENCSIVDNCAPAFLMDIRTALLKTKKGRQLWLGGEANL